MNFFSNPASLSEEWVVRLKVLSLYLWLGLSGDQCHPGAIQESIQSHLIRTRDSYH